MYTSELNALKRSNRYRKREILDSSLIDFASNDYLGLANDRARIASACETLKTYETFAPKASQLINGYHRCHKDFEEALAHTNAFEEALLVGSGFLANLVLIESLVRKNDILFLDEEYHASGILASRLVAKNVVFFKHNSLEDLKEKFKKATFKRALIAVEGVYSMSGALVKKEILEFALENSALLIVDDAHANGVLGEKLCGILDHYDIEITENIIKMGTLGKAYGSYGAYICAASRIIEFLINRGKGVIYSTALSLFDTTLALENLSYIQKNRSYFSEQLRKKREIARAIFGFEPQSQILSIAVGEEKKLMTLGEEIRKIGYVVGTIRKPTVQIPSLRVILRANNSDSDTERLLGFIREKTC